MTTVDIDNMVQQHSAISSLAAHYNQINWSLHTIFVPLQSVIGMGIVSQLFSGTHSLSNMVHFLLVSGCIAGLVTVFQWWKIYVRHRSMIRILYGKLHVIEDEIAKAHANAISPFEVHKILKKYDDEFKALGKSIYGTDTALRFLFGLFVTMYASLLAVCMITWLR